MGHILFGYKKTERGTIEHRYFDSEELLTPQMRTQGWYDSPDKAEKHGVQDVNTHVQDVNTPRRGRPPKVA